MPSIELIGRKFRTEVPLGLSLPVPTGGGSQIEEEARPGRDAISVYIGDALEKWDVPILFDGWRSRNKTNQGPRIRQIMALASGGKAGPPPHFKVKGPVLFSNGIFTMESRPEWSADPAPIVTDSGAIYRLGMILHLVQHNPAQAPKWKKIAQGVSFNYPSTYTLPEPMNLVKVAMINYGSPALAPAIGKLNGIHDVRKKLEKGKKLNLPDEEGGIGPTREA